MENNPSIVRGGRNKTATLLRPVPVPDTPAEQIATINETGPVDAYESTRYRYENKESDAEAELDMMDMSEFENYDASNEYDTLDAAGEVDLEIPSIPNPVTFTETDDPEIPSIPSGGAEVSEARLLKEQEVRDQILVDQQIDEALTPPPEVEVGSVQNQLKNLPGVAGDAAMSLLKPFAALGAGGAAYANPSNTGDVMTDLKNDFVSVGKYALDALQGKDLEDIGLKIATDRWGLTGKTAQLAGGMFTLVTDPSVPLSFGYLKVLQTGLKLAQQRRAVGLNQVGKQITKTDEVLNDMTNAVYEVLTFGKSPEQVHAATLKNGGTEEEAFQAALIHEERVNAIVAAGARADETGSQADIKAFHDAIEGEPIIQDAARKMEEAQAAEELQAFQGKLGNPEGDKFIFDFENLTDEAMNASLKSDVPLMPTRMNTATINTIEDADGALDDLLSVHAGNYDNLAPANPVEASMLDVKQQERLTSLVGQPTKPLSGRAAYAARQVLVASAQDLRRLAQNTKGPLANSLDALALEKALAVHRRAIERLTGRDMDATKIFNSYNMKGLEGKQLRDELASSASTANRNVELRLLAREFIRSETDPTIISKIADKSAWARTADVAFEVYVNAILSGPVTHAVNIASNTTLLFWAPTQNTMEALSAVARFDFEQGADKIAEAGARMSGLAQGMSDAMRIVFKQDSWDDLKLDGTHFASGEIARMRLKPSLTSENLAATGMYGQAVDLAGSTVRLPGAALQKEDKFFKLLHYRANINASAVQLARKSGADSTTQRNLYQTLRHNPSEAMSKKAIKEGEIATFTNELGKIGSPVHDAIKSVPGARFFFPFFATPTNIVKMGLKNSVFGNIFTDFKHLGELNAAGDTARARVALGTAIPLAIIMNIDDDIITGRIDQSSEKGRFDASQNKPPYSIRIGDEWYSYEKIEPLRSILGLYVNWKQAVGAMRTHDDNGYPTNQYMEAGTAAIAPVIQTIGDTYMLKQVGGVLGLLDSLQTLEPTYAIKQLEKLSVSAVPFSGLGRQVNNTLLDGTYRMANGWVENAMKIIPGLSERLPAKLTVWGDPQLYADGVGPDMISPLKTAAVKFDRYDRFLTEVGANVPGAKKQMTVPLKGGKGIEVDLNTAQQQRLVQLRAVGTNGNAPLKDVFKQLIDNPKFLQMAPSEQKDLIDVIFGRATEAAEKLLLAEDKTIQEDALERLNYRQENIQRGRNANRGRTQ